MVGYGNSWIVDCFSKIVMVFGGYVDGLIWLLLNNVIFWVGDVFCLLVGCVLMDLLMIDVIDLIDIFSYLLLIILF